MNGLNSADLRIGSKFVQTCRRIHQIPRLAALVYTIGVGVILTAVYVCRDAKRRATVGSWLLFCSVMIPRYYFNFKHLGYKMD